MDTLLLMCAFALGALVAFFVARWMYSSSDDYDSFYHDIESRKVNETIKREQDKESQKAEDARFFQSYCRYRMINDRKQVIANVKKTRGFIEEFKIDLEKTRPSEWHLEWLDYRNMCLCVGVYLGDMLNPEEFYVYKENIIHCHDGIAAYRDIWPEPSYMIHDLETSEFSHGKGAQKSLEAKFKKLYY